MANNKNTTAINSTLLLNRVGELSNRLKIISQTPALGQTQEGLIIEANQLLSDFFTDISGPLFNPADVVADTKPDPSDYNDNLTKILSDLTILFAELKNTSDTILSNFNYIISDNNRLLGKLKGSYSKLGDYILFSGDPTKDSIFFSDSFNNLDRVDFNSKLISTTQAEVNQGPGIVTLPIDTSQQATIVVTTAPTINGNSNGTPGNNVEAGAAVNDDITTVLDDNPDTWFEYERVIINEVDTFDALILDITLNLDTSKIINYIRINPNNFGTKNSVIIDTIETSVDGHTFINIKEDIPGFGYELQDGDNLFSLSPATSEFAGQGIYLFTARFAKYVHLTFRQTTPYGIIDSTGTSRIRYAIGIRDIEIQAIQYLDQGEVISNAYTTDEAIKKVAVISHQFPEDDSSLISIQHFVSPDDGLTWNQINPTDIETDDTSIPSIINYNTLDNDSINTASPVQSIRYKAILNRNTANFNNPSSFKTNNIVSVSELLQLPAVSPFQLQLNNMPITGTLKVIDPAYGSRGITTNRFVIGLGTGTTISFIIPYFPLKKDKFRNNSGDYAILEDEDPQEIRVNGKVWFRAVLATAAAIDEVYELNYSTGELTFGDGTHGKAVPLNATVDIMLYPERLIVSSDDAHIVTLGFASSNDKQSFTIQMQGQVSTANQTLRKGVTTNQLDNQNVIDTKFSDTTVFATYVTYVDGESELNVPGKYSIDYINGIVYSQLPTNAINETTVSYTYQPVTALDSTEWDFVKDSNYTQISINADSFTSLSVINELVQPSTKYFALRNGSLLQNTVTFAGSSSDTIFAREVPFINGQTELALGTPTLESIGALGTLPITTYTFRTPISSSAELKVLFSNTTIFATEELTLGAVVSAGQYYIDRSANTIAVFIAGPVDDAGTVTYYYNDRMKSNDGLYSINYGTGEVFTATATDTGLTVNYNYSDYTAIYNLVRVVDPLSFVYDTDSNIVTINEREVLYRLGKSKNSTQNNFYQMLYDMVGDSPAELKQLAAYFSPMLRDYALKVILESSLLF